MFSNKISVKWLRKHYGFELKCTYKSTISVNSLSWLFLNPYKSCISVKYCTIGVTLYVLGLSPYISCICYVHNSMFSKAHTKLWKTLSSSLKIEDSFSKCILSFWKTSSSRSSFNTCANVQRSQFFSCEVISSPSFAFRLQEQFMFTSLKKCLVLFRGGCRFKRRVISRNVRVYGSLSLHLLTQKGFWLHRFLDVQVSKYYLSKPSVGVKIRGPRTRRSFFKRHLN